MLRLLLAPLLFSVVCIHSAFAAPLIVNSVNTTKSLAQSMTWLEDPAGKLGIEDVLLPEQQERFSPLQEEFPLDMQGPVWLKLNLANTSTPNSRAFQSRLQVQLGDLPKGSIQVFSKGGSLLVAPGAWTSDTLSSDAPILLPEVGASPESIYIRLNESPGLWFHPMVSPQGQEHQPLIPLELVLPGLLALGAIGCLLRFLATKKAWSLWSALLLGIALLHSQVPLPPINQILSYAALPTILTPGLSLMLLPHIGRCILQTNKHKSIQDPLLATFSFVGIGVALVPLAPGFHFLIRLFPLWGVLLLPLLPFCLWNLAHRRQGSLAFAGVCCMPFIGSCLAFYAIHTPLPAPFSSQGALWGLAVAGIGLALTRGPQDSEIEEPAQPEQTPTPQQELAGLYDVNSIFGTQTPKAAPPQKGLPDFIDAPFGSTKKTVVAPQPEEQKPEMQNAAPTSTTPKSHLGSAEGEAPAFTPITNFVDSAGLINGEVPAIANPLGASEDLEAQAPLVVPAHPAFQEAPIAMAVEARNAMPSPTSELQRSTAVPASAAAPDTDNEKQYTQSTEQPTPAPTPKVGSASAPLHQDKYIVTAQVHEPPQKEVKEQTPELATHPELAQPSRQTSSLNLEASPNVEQKSSTPSNPARTRVVVGAISLSTDGKQNQNIVTAEQEAKDPSISLTPLVQTTNTTKATPDLSGPQEKNNKEEGEQQNSPAKRESKRASIIIQVPSSPASDNSAPLQSMPLDLQETVAPPSTPEDVPSSTASSIEEKPVQEMEPLIKPVDASPTPDVALQKKPSRPHTKPDQPVATDVNSFLATISREFLPQAQAHDVSVECTGRGLPKELLLRRDALREILFPLLQSAVTATGDSRISLRAEAEATHENQCLAHFIVTAYKAQTLPSIDIEEIRSQAIAAGGNFTLHFDQEQNLLYTLTLESTLPKQKTENIPPVIQEAALPETTVAPQSFSPMLFKEQQVAAKIIVVDMTTSNLRLLSHYLQDQPCEHFEVRQPDQLSEAYVKEPADLIIVDADMPETDIIQGIASLRAVEEQIKRPPVPILALVSNMQQSSRMLQAGCTKVLPKPFTQQELIGIVQNCIPSLPQTVTYIPPPPPKGKSQQLFSPTLTESEENYIHRLLGKPGEPSAPHRDTAKNKQKKPHTAETPSERIRVTPDHNRHDLPPFLDFIDAKATAHKETETKKPHKLAVNETGKHKNRLRATEKEVAKLKGSATEDKQEQKATKKTTFAPVDVKKVIVAAQPQSLETKGHSEATEEQHALTSPEQRASMPLPDMEEQSVYVDQLPFAPNLIYALKDALDLCAQSQAEQQTVPVLQAAKHLVQKAEQFGLEKLGKLAGCVERAAAADDLEAVTVLSEDLVTSIKKHLASVEKCYKQYLNIL